MITEWTKHLRDPEEKEEFTTYIKSTKRLLERLTTLLDEKEQSLDKSEASLQAYDNPNWDYRQAHNNGYRSCLRALKRLINLDQQETK